MGYADPLSRLDDILDAIDEAQRFTAGMSFEIEEMLRDIGTSETE